MQSIKRVNAILAALLIAALCGCGGAKDPGKAPTAADTPEAETPVADPQAPETQPAPPPLSTDQIADPKARAIVERYIEAVGGLEANQKLRTRRIKARMTGEAEQAITITQVAPDKQIMDFFVGQHPAKEVVNGTQAWIEVEKGPGSRMFEGAELQSKLQGARFHSAIEMLTTGDISYVKDVAVDGQEWQQLTASFGEGSPWEGMQADIFLDKSTHLIRRLGGTVTQRLVDGKMQPTVVNLSNYMAVDGIKLPGRGEVKAAGLNFVCVVDSIRHGVEVDVANGPFNPPLFNQADAAAVLGRMTGNWDLENRNLTIRNAPVTQSAASISKTASGEAIRYIDSSGVLWILAADPTVTQRGRFVGIRMSGVETEVMRGYWDRHDQVLSWKSMSAEIFREAGIRLPNAGGFTLETGYGDWKGKNRMIFHHVFEARDRAAELPKPEKHAVLDRFLGTWDLEGGFKAAGQGPVSFKNTAICSRPVGNTLHFDQPRQEDSNAGEFQMLLTYDSVKNDYPAVIMMVKGRKAWRATGTWIAAEQTMIYRNTSKNGNSFLLVSTFNGPDRYTDSTTLTGKDGKLLWEQTVTFTRAP